jgi:murein L,D-transpeptidase YcbB/YkuD
MSSSIFAAVRVVALGLAATSVFAQIPDVGPVGLSPDGPAAIRARLDASGSPQPLCATAEGRAIWDAVQAFYAARGDQPVWTSGAALTPAGQRLMGELGGVADEGLDPSLYDPGALAGAPPVLRVAAGGEGFRDPASVEIGLTAALARYASDLANGRVDARRVTVLWRLRPRAFDALPVLQQAAERSGGGPSRRPIRHATLRAALRRYAA